MDLNSIISQISETHLGLGAGAILVITIVLGIIKGALRILLGLIGLVAAAAAFWFAFRHGDTITSKFIENPDPWVPLGIGGTAAASAYIVVRHGVGMIFKPLLGSVDGSKKRRILSGFMGLGLGGAGLYGGGHASHQFEAMNFLREHLQSEEQDPKNWVITLLTKSQESWFGNFHQTTDPTKTAYRCDLIKILGLYTSGRTANFKQESIKPILENTDFRGLASDPSIAKALNEKDFQTLFRHEKVKAFLKKKENLELLQGIDWLKTI